MVKDVELASLLSEAFAGADDAWTRLLTATQPRLLAYARRLLGQRDDLAEDVLQDAYTRLAGLSHSSRTALVLSSPWGYLMTVVRHAVYDTKRKERREVRRIEAMHAGDFDQISDEPSATLWDEIMPMLGTNDRLLLGQLRVGRSVAANAAALGLSREAYAQRRHRLLRRLRQYVVLKELSRSAFED